MVSIPVLVNRAYPARRVPRNLYFTPLHSFLLALPPFFFFSYHFYGLEKFWRNFNIANNIVSDGRGKGNIYIYIRLRVIDLSLNGEEGEGGGRVTRRGKNL